MRRESGFGLVEILVVLTLLSVALVGLIAFQRQLFQAHQQAYYMAVVVQQVNNLTERMRVNPDGLFAYLDHQEIPNLPSCSVCTPEQQALRDLHQWNQQNQTLLPAGFGLVRQEEPLFEIVLMWDHYRTGATGKDCDAGSEQNLYCFSLFTNGSPLKPVPAQAGAGVR